MTLSHIAKNKRKTLKRAAEGKSMQEILAKWEAYNKESGGTANPQRKRSKKGSMSGKGGPENAGNRYMGVRQRTWGKWVAEIREPKYRIGDPRPTNGRRLWLGTYATDVEAALEYDKAAKSIYSLNAILNFPEGPPVTTKTRECSTLESMATSNNYQQNGENHEDKRIKRRYFKCEDTVAPETGMESKTKPEEDEKEQTDGILHEGDTDFIKELESIVESTENEDVLNDSRENDGCEASDQKTELVDSENDNFWQNLFLSTSPGDETVAEQNHHSNLYKSPSDVPPNSSAEFKDLEK